MLDATTKRLIQLLDPSRPEDIRVASAKVLGEVASRAPELNEALFRAMDDSSSALRLQALSTLGQLRIDEALPKLLERISAGGPEAELAAQAAARLGAKGTHALQKLMHHVAPGLRPRLAAALAVGGTPTANTAAVEALLDKDPGVVNAAVSTLIGEIRSLTTSQRRTLTERVIELLKPKKNQPISSASESALMRLVAALGDSRGENSFWQRIGREHSTELRAAALQALGTVAPPRDKKRIGQLLECAIDRDFRVAAPALMILKNLPISERDTSDWLPLFEAPDPAVRRFALEKLGDRDRADVAQALLAQVDHSDRSLQEEAIGRMAKTKAGRALLLKSLLEAPSPDAAWTFARAQSRFATQYPAHFSQLFKRACQALDADDRRADALLFLLRHIDAKALRDKLEDRALALRKKRKYEQALVYLRLLARDPGCAEDTRFELASCGLKLSERNLALESRNADPALQQFARLLHSAEVEPKDRIKQAKWLGPEELLYLGFHFIEGSGKERDFGADALRLAIKRSPKSKMAKDAKTKLRSAGLDLKG
jgi:HEAT repeat protein